MITKSGNLVTSYDHPTGIHVRYSTNAVVEESIPLQLGNLVGFHVTLYRCDRNPGCDVFIRNVDPIIGSMTVSLLDDTGLPMAELVHVKLSDIAVLEVM